MVLSYCRVPVWIVTPSQLQNPSQRPAQETWSKVLLGSCQRNVHCVRERTGAALVTVGGSAVANHALG